MKYLTEWALSLSILLGGVLVAAHPDGSSIPSGEVQPDSEGVPEIELVELPGGTFTMGVDDDGVNGPEREVTVSPFSIGVYEITWDQYEAYMFSEQSEVLNDRFSHLDAAAVTRPSRTYIDPSHGMGGGASPAISMTQHAALAFTRWLSLKTGEFYRLPTEAEWEYACRAGNDTFFHFGDDEEDLEEYGLYYMISNQEYEPVGERKPNAWGLYDMHGNVAEWTMDQYIEEYHEEIGEGAEDPWIEPTSLEPRTVRGGSWYHDPDQLGCASRIGSDPDRWKRGDPQFPKSLWWNSNSPFVGFRIVKPAEQPTEEEMHAFWENTLDEYYYE